MARKRSAEGQSSLEFLMTYGWALLIIIIAVIIVWQWGFFSFADTIQPGSFGFWGVYINDFVMESDGTLKVSMLNGVGANITVFYYNVTQGMVFEDCDSCLPLPIPSGQSRIQTIRNLQPGTPGTRFEVNMIIRYNDTRLPGTEFMSSGKIWGNYGV
ncbi:hypothetical protein ACFLRF_01005 [Candidatus Altiarchaeota archaeon]